MSSNTERPDKPSRSARLKTAAVMSAVTAAILAAGFLAIGHERRGEQRTGAPSATTTSGVDLDQVTHGWTDPGALTFTHDAKAHLPKHGLQVLPNQTEAATLEIVKPPNSGYRAILHEPYQFRYVYALDYGLDEDTPKDPHGNVRYDQPVELAVPPCETYWSQAPLIPAASCEETADVIYDGRTLPRYAMALGIRDLQPGAEGWVSPDAFAIQPYGCLVADVDRPMRKQATATVKITTLSIGSAKASGWRADGPVPPANELPPADKGYPSFYANVLATHGDYKRCPSY